jgi:hypothetical protein
MQTLVAVLRHICPISRDTILFQAALLVLELDVGLFLLNCKKRRAYCRARVITEKIKKNVDLGEKQRKKRK